MIDDGVATRAARSVATAALGRDPGPMTRVDSKSHHVFVGEAAVVKIIDAGDHARLDREIALGADLPAGVSAPVLSSGLLQTDAGGVRYACVARLPGTSPGMGLDGVDRETALRWARQATDKLRLMHAWVPGTAAATVLREPLEHGGFVTRSALLDSLERVRELDSSVPASLLDGLTAIAARAPEQAGTVVPVHADCHWGNWLVHDRDVSTLLDFEWARFGEPVDDWMFLARFSGPHMQSVVDLIADETGTPIDGLRADCEVREAAYLTSDLLLELQRPSGADQAEVEHLVGLLSRIVVERLWWPEH